jgi:pyruvate dehydrogenase E2 component (dihydrolipoamide acetyltransferase)
MPIEVILPKVDMDMENGIITEWKVAPGDRVSAGQILFDIETNKSVMEVESPGSGIIRDLAPITGEPVAVGTVVGWIDVDGESAATSPAPANHAHATAARPRGRDRRRPRSSRRPRLPARFARRLLPAARRACST